MMPNILMRIFPKFSRTPARLTDVLIWEVCITKSGLIVIFVLLGRAAGLSFVIQSQTYSYQYLIRPRHQDWYIATRHLNNQNKYIIQVSVTYIHATPTQVKSKHQEANTSSNSERICISIIINNILSNDHNEMKHSCSNCVSLEREDVWGCSLHYISA